MLTSEVQPNDKLRLTLFKADLQPARLTIINFEYDHTEVIELTEGMQDLGLGLGG